MEELMASNRQKKIIRPKANKITAKNRESRFSAKSLKTNAKSASADQGKWILGLWGGWVLALMAFLSLANFQRVLPWASSFAGLPFYPLLIAGLVVMVFCLYHVPAPARVSDLSSVQGRIGFFLLLALGAFLRLHDPSLVVGKICDDSKVIAYEVRRILDFHDYPVLLAYGNREPMYDYLVALVWTIFPKITGFFIFRLTSTLIDLATAWFLYLLGKEAGGRRVGLLLMGLAIMAKGLVDYAFFSVGVGTLVMGCALTMLFLLGPCKGPA